MTRASQGIFYCGPEGISVWDLASACLGRNPELPGWNQLAERCVIPTYLGRVAVWQLCKLWQLGPEHEVLMPAYNCGTEVDPFVRHGCKVTLYRVDRNAQIDVEDIIRRKSDRTKVVYVTHYFGWAHRLKRLAAWCRENEILLVEDCALSLFSSGPDGPLGLVGDASIFSLGKFLPVPAAGILALRQLTGGTPRLRAAARRETMKRTRSLLKTNFLRRLDKVGCYSLSLRLKTRFDSPPRIDKSERLPDIPKDYYFDPELEEAGIPRVSLGLLSSVDPESVRRQRRENCLELESRLKNVPGVVPLYQSLPEGACPFAFPVITRNRNEFNHYLKAHGVSTCPFWEGYHRELLWDDFPEARCLKDTVTALPVNQSLGKSHMQYIADRVAEYCSSGVDKN